MSYEIYLGVDDCWWWRLYADNGRVIAHGTQGHRTADQCRREIALVKGSAGAAVSEATAAVSGTDSREAW
jgi:uncharacterized protein YegP (UPF0339 family)